MAMTQMTQSQINSIYNLDATKLLTDSDIDAIPSYGNVEGYCCYPCIDGNHNGIVDSICITVGIGYEDIDEWTEELYYRINEEHIKTVPLTEEVLALLK